MSRYKHTLADLISDLPLKAKAPDVTVSYLSVDTRDISQGTLFIALKGERFDARSCIQAAIDSGAVAVLVDANETPSLGASILKLAEVIEVSNLADHLSLIASRFYNHPSHALKVVGITGTNGKTTVAYYLAQVFDSFDVNAVVMGTLGSGKVGSITSTGMTTLDAVSVQKQLADFVDQHVETVFMEVSSHGLALGRVSAVKFEHVIFTNLTQDHLDFHPDMQAYANAKRTLFVDFDFSSAVINQDDRFGAELLKDSVADVISFGFKKGELRASEIELTQGGLQFSVTYQSETTIVKSGLIGQFNVSNLLAVIGAGLAAGFPLDSLADVISGCHAAPGRMERVRSLSSETKVVIDYAHTPDALSNALLACRSHCQGQLSVVFGCGGDRDQLKRPQMGQIAEHLADVVFITDDNPRTESASEIVADIVKGMQHACWVLHDRPQAVMMAISQSGPNDWVLIAGKGHETKQIFADRVIEMDDRILAKRAFERLAA